MDEVRALLEALNEKPFVRGRLRGLFHILIGRTIATAEGAVVSTGLTWRQVATELKASKFDKDLVTELGVNPDSLAPRDREKMWYLAVGLAKVDSLDATEQAEQLIAPLKQLGYSVGPSPSMVSASSASSASAMARKKRK